MVADILVMLLHIPFYKTTTLVSFLLDRTNAEKELLEGNTEDYLGEGKYLWIYGCLVGAVFIGNAFRAVGFFSYCSKISINVHDSMFQSIVRAPPRFFDENPSGRQMGKYLYCS